MRERKRRRQGEEVVKNEEELVRVKKRERGKLEVNNRFGEKREGNQEKKGEVKRGKTRLNKGTFFSSIWATSRRRRKLLFIEELFQGKKSEERKRVDLKTAIEEMWKDRNLICI